MRVAGRQQQLKSQIQLVIKTTTPAEVALIPATINQQITIPEEVLLPHPTALGETAAAVVDQVVREVVEAAEEAQEVVN